MGRQVTEQQIDRDQLRAVAHHAEQANSAVYLAPRDLLALLDQAEARLAEEKHLRMKATAAATKVEARVKAVEDVLDAEEARPRPIGGGYDKRATVRIADIRRALRGV